MVHCYMNRYFIYWEARVNPSTVIGAQSFIYELEGIIDSDELADITQELYQQLPTHIQAFDPTIVIVNVSWLPG